MTNHTLAEIELQSFKKEKITFVETDLQSIKINYNKVINELKDMTFTPSKFYMLPINPKTSSEHVKLLRYDIEKSKQTFSTGFPKLSLFWAIKLIEDTYNYMVICPEPLASSKFISTFIGKIKEIKNSDLVSKNQKIKMDYYLANTNYLMSN